MGYALADARITERIRKIHDFLTVGAPAPLQHACVAALGLPGTYYQELAAMYDRKRKILFAGLEKAGFRCELPEGAYYIFTDISGFDMTDTEFARYLVEKIGIAAVPGSLFTRTAGGPGFGLRFRRKMRRWWRHAAARNLDQV